MPRLMLCTEGRIATWLWLVGLLLLLSSNSGLALESNENDAVQRNSHLPNVVVILVDDMGYGDPGCFNPDSQIPTPHIDNLARQGMKFTDAHAPGPLCHMSRYGLVTGRYPFRTDVTRWRNEPLIAPGQPTIATIAKQAGYQTAMVGKWHLGFQEQGYDKPLKGGPTDHGFDQFFGIRASTDIPPYFYIRGNRAVELPSETIKANRSEGWSPIQGEFWRAGGIAPSLELKEVLPRFTSEAIEIIENHANTKSNTQPNSGDDQSTPLMLYLAYPSPHTPWLPSEEFVGKSGAGAYGDFVAMLDAEIGKILAALDTAGMRDDTLLVFTSDNGPCWYDKDVQKYGHDSAAGLRGMKGDAWEAGHRMPFIACWPGVVSPGSESDQVICFTDLLATFASIMKVSLPADVLADSFSLLPVLQTQQPANQPIRGPVVMNAGSHPSTMVIRNGDWKLITGLGSGGFSPPTTVQPKPGEATGQLYHLANDPSEQNNLYEKHPKIVASGKKALAKIVGTNAAAVTVAESVDCNTLTGKVMCGYQGWFNTPGDGMQLGWTHWARNGNKLFAPKNVTVDIWPDVSELSEKALYETGFRHADGSVAKVFSSADQETTNLHFRWMREYGIDGAFLQRFANGLGNKSLMRHKNQVLKNVRKAAAANGRAYVVMYDLSGLRSGTVKRVFEDWQQLQRKERVTQDENYLKHNGKPLVAVWGVGFTDDGQPRDYSLGECRELVLELKKAGCSVMLGVPTAWRDLNRDSMSDPELHEVIKLADVISPWTPGRYRDLEGVKRHGEKYWEPDVEWCAKHDLDYLPVSFPGFSWHNLKDKPLGEISRLKGKFLWSQFVAAKRAGANMLYVAMFDEVDEGTAIFKCTDEPPVGDDVTFLTNDGLPSDHYLWLTGEAGRMLRGERSATRTMPRR